MFRFTPIQILITTIYIITYGICQNIINKQILYFDAPVTVNGIINQWNIFEQALNKNNVTKLIIRNTIMDLQGIKKLFSYNLTKIKSFRIQHTNVNKPIIEFIMANKKIQQLQELGFVNCNMFCQDFQGLLQKQTKIKKLELTDNLIAQEGFIYLTKMKMQLNQLKLQKTSLITKKAVDSVISYGLSQIKAIDLTQSSISGQNLLKILKSIDLSKLQNLTISKNTFQQNFYRQFSKFNFTALKNLQIADLNIDQDGFQYFFNMNFPNLTNLNLNENQLTNQIGQKFITKARMPKLQKIYLNNNFITSKFIRHLKQQNFVLKYISCLIPKMDTDGLKTFSQLNTTQLEVFFYTALNAKQDIVKNFIQNTNFENLKFLNLGKIKNAGHFFQSFFQRAWPKLTNLYFQPQIIKIDPQLYKKGIIFPSLKKIMLQFTGNNQQIIVQLLKNIQKVAPKIQQITIQAPILFQTIYAVINGSLNRIFNKTVTLTLITSIPFEKTLQLTYFADKLPKIKKISLPHTFLNVLLSKGQILIHQLQNLTDISQLNFEEFDLQQFLNIAFQILNFQNTLHTNFDFSELIQLQQSYQLNFIKRLLDNNNGNYTFSFLKQFQMQVDQDTNLSLIQKCQFPSVKNLQLQSSYSQQKQIQLNSLNHKFLYIKTINTDLPLNKQQFKQLFRNNKFEYMSTLSLIQIKNLTANDLKQIQKQIPYFHRIKYFSYDQAFINNDLTFLTNTGIKPYILGFQNILFNTGVIQQLCSLDLQFLSELIITNCGVNDKSLVQLLECMQTKKYNNQQTVRSIHLPKIRHINVDNNYIGKLGFQKLMSMQMPLLTKLQLDSNADSQVFNSIFSSIWSRKIFAFQLMQKKFDSIDSTLNPKNTRKLRILTIGSSILYNTDILALSQMQFNSLQSLQLGLSKLQTCQQLQNLLKLTKNTIQIKFVITNSPKLNSTCLLDSNYKDQSWLEPEELGIKGNQYYGQISHFAYYLIIKTKQWQKLGLNNVYLSQQLSLMLLDYTIFINTTQIILTYCGLSNKFIQKLGNKNLQNIQNIILKGNPITGQAFQTFNNITFNQLFILQLTQTNISDIGIQYLIRNNYPKLAYLQLTNTQITRQGILLLNQLNAPRLQAISLSCNGLTVSDLQLFDISKFRNLIEIQIYPSITRKQYNRLHQVYEKKRQNMGGIIKLPIQIETTIIEPTPLELYLQSEGIYYQGQDQETMQ